MTQACFAPNPESRRFPSAPSRWRPALGAFAAACLAFLVAAPPAGAQAARERPAFDVESPIALLMDADSGKVLFEKNADEPHPPASIAKVMTMLLVAEAVEGGEISLDDTVVVSARASKIGGSQAYLAEGEEMTVRDLLKAVAIHSANDACVALAEHVSGVVEAFVDRMNDKARELGMKNTVFHSPHGLPPDRDQEPDMTTARDISIMSRELILKHPMILEYTGKKSDSLRGGRFRLDNTNRLVGRVAGVDGLKTGYTRASGFGLVATAERRGLRLLSVTLGAKSGNQRSRDSARLLSYGFSKLRSYLAAKKDQDVGELKVRRGRAEKVGARIGKDLRILLQRGDERRLTFEVKPLADLSAPIEMGEVIGTYEASLDGKLVGKAPIVAKKSVEKANLIILFFRWFLALIGLR
jgi:D-alanyl-D-alanine carboxypeptidase (penicillin-binding protein 5/6)